MQKNDDTKDEQDNHPLSDALHTLALDRLCMSTLHCYKLLHT